MRGTDHDTHYAVSSILQLPHSAHKYLSRWEIVKHRVSQGSILGLLLLIIYIKDFSLSIDTISDTIFFTDDASVLISNRHFNEFMNTFNMVISHIAKWFHANQLIRNKDKTNIGKSTAYRGTSHTLPFEHANKLLLRFLNLNSLCLTT